MVGWSRPNSEICVRVARYEFSKNHPTFPTKYSNSLYVSQLYGRFSVVFFSQKIYLSYFFFQNRHFLAKKFFLGQTYPASKGPPDPPRALLCECAIINGDISLFLKFSKFKVWHVFCRRRFLHFWHYFCIYAPPFLFSVIKAGFFACKYLIFNNLQLFSIFYIK